MAVPSYMLALINQGLASNVVLRSDLATKNLGKGAGLALSLGTIALNLPRFPPRQMFR